MKRAPSRNLSGAADLSAPRDIDALYGLEPVIEPGREPSRGRGTAAVFHSIQCPYCGERFDTLVDTGTGTATYIEDCQVCCQPIEFDLQVDAYGTFVSLSVHRG